MSRNGVTAVYIETNNNPLSRTVGDCAVRAVALALGIEWEEAYAKLASAGYAMADMPSSNAVIAAVLRQNGFYRNAIADTCPICYTAENFCTDNPEGIFVLCFDWHVATVIDGDIYDAWDCSQEIPQYYWYRKKKKEVEA